MIRKSTFTLDMANTGKKFEILRVLEESRRVTNVFIEVLWNKQESYGKFCHLKTDTWLSVRLQQVLSKQALEMVKSQRQRKKKFKPTFKKLTMNLDSRFVEFLHLENSFDFWVKIASLGSKHKLIIPAKKHRHFNQLITEGWKLKSFTRVAVKGNTLILDVYFEKEAPVKKSDGQVIGIDIGFKKLIATSEGNLHGEGFEKLAAKIQRKKQGSKRFKKALVERNEYINKTVKELPWPSTAVLVIEQLKGLKNGRHFRKQFQAKFQRWTYPALVNRLKLTSETQGVLVQEVNPAYTSQTCSRCGCKDKNNRKGEVFACTGCNYESDADVNASVNILKRFRLPEYSDPVKFVL